MLPADRELKFSEVLECSDFESVLSRMINKEVASIFYKSVEEIAEYFERRLQLSWPTAQNRRALVTASLVRNCIIHNGARVDSRLERRTGWKVGNPISLSASDVHEYGIEARSVARQIYSQAEGRHFNAV